MKFGKFFNWQSSKSVYKSRFLLILVFVWQHLL